LGEVERALTDHELIKIRVNALERDVRAAAISQIVEATGAVLVQTIGKIMVLYRANPDTDPELSNITRRTD
jgi:RNA-binding protein